MQTECKNEIFAAFNWDCPHKKGSCPANPIYVLSEEEEDDMEVLKLCRHYRIHGMLSLWADIEDAKEAGQGQKRRLNVLIRTSNILNEYL
jgi:hypothetical protein